VRYAAQFASLLFSALAMVPAMAHLMELPNKIRLSRADYFVAQQLYRGWALAGVVVTAALLSTAARVPGRPARSMRSSCAGA
jgi:hypothetical protein